KLALDPQHAEHESAWRPLPHDMGARCAPAQRVKDKTSDRRTVTRPCKPMGEPPILERVSHGTAPRFDIGHDLDGGGETGGRRHPSPSRMRTAKMTHIAASTTMPARNTAPRRGTLLSVTWMKACTIRNATKIQASTRNR